MNKILVVEDDEILSEGIKASLENQNTEVTQADCVKAALHSLHKESFDLAVLDVNLPDGNGYQLCRKIKENWDLPIIFLTARDMESDVVLGLESGADDYITKPFSLRILQARIDAVLRRIGKRTKENKIVIGSLKIDFEHMLFEKDGEKLLLSMTEQKLLKVLLSNRGSILTKEQLIDKVWQEEAGGIDDNALTVSIKRLRSKLEDTPSAPKYIKNIYGVGYTWVKEDGNGRKQ